MSMIDVLKWNEGMEGCVDRAGTRIQVEGAVVVHCDHVVLGLGFGPAIWIRGIFFLQGDQFVLVEGGEIFPGGGAEIAT